MRLPSCTFRCGSVERRRLSCLLPYPINNTSHESALLALPHAIPSRRLPHIWVNLESLFAPPMKGDFIAA